MKKILKESGIRDIKELSKRYPKAEIYFHQDLDGVTTAIAMKKYLENNCIDVVDTHIIQYGDKEFAVKKNDAQGDTMPVLVDFAHGKPMFVIHTDHHDRQAGAEDTKSTSFRQSRSNVETLSQIVSPKELFPSSDILLISTVDSADFARKNLTPEDVYSTIYYYKLFNPNGKVIMVGHSIGGDNVIQVVNRLNKNKINIDLAILIDPANKKENNLKYNIPNNVNYLINLTSPEYSDNFKFFTNSGGHGIKSGVNLNYINVDTKNTEHTSIDNTVYIKINKLINDFIVKKVNPITEIKKYKF